MSLVDEFKDGERIFKKSLKSAALYAFVASTCMLAMPVFLMQVYGKVLMSRSMETLIAFGGVAFVILIAYGYYDGLKLKLLGRAATEFEARMAGPIMAAEMARATDMRLQTLQEVGQLRQLASSPGFAAIFDLPVMPFFMILVFLIHPILGLVLLGGAGVLLGLALRADRVVEPFAKANMEARMNAQQAMQMYAASQETVKSQGMYNEVVGHWGQKNARVLETSVISTELISGYASWSKAARQLLQISIIGAGAVLVLSDMATAGVIFAASIIGGRALQPIEQVLGSWRNLKQGLVTYKELMQRLETLKLPEETTPLPRPKGAITLDRVAYVPAPGAQPIIKGISGTIYAGENVAIIGASGAGKSTLARMLASAIEPSMGKITLDGQDLRAWDPRARGLFVGYMPQNVTFFDGTIGENIARLRDDDLQLAVDAAQLAGVHDLILTMPQGYDTVIKTQGGFKPSGGQGQLIALARAFYGKPAVLILDEPNAALDQNGEAIFHKALGTAKKLGITVVLVTQRPSALAYSDKVMVMEAGLVKQYDDRDKVVSGNRVGGAAPSQGQQAQQQQPAAAQAATQAKAKPAKADDKIKAAAVKPQSVRKGA
ncbi:MAG: ATP-binding cassette domain-containing protein [Kordiimonadaceae bacterium]|nr:ATP-binding cassette domain-containing protein [Kordiimonadaceae bacterium]